MKNNSLKTKHITHATPEVARATRQTCNSKHQCNKINTLSAQPVSVAPATTSTGIPPHHILVLYYPPPVRKSNIHFSYGWNNYNTSVPPCNVLYDSLVRTYGLIEHLYIFPRNPTKQPSPLRDFNHLHIPRNHNLVAPRLRGLQGGCNK